MALSPLLMEKYSPYYDNLDIKPIRKDFDSKGKPIVQRAHIHEIGHLLGLGHIDIGKPHCPAAGDTNAAACYGVADDDKKSVMGEGMALRRIFANPWRRAAVKLTGKGNAASAADWASRMHRFYPRTPREVVAGREVTVRVHPAAI